MRHQVFPEEKWASLAPEDAGFRPDALANALAWMEATADTGYRLTMIRDGYQVVNICKGYDAAAKFNLASAAKSIYSNVLGIVVAEGQLPSADARVADIYPEMMDVPPGTGPKEGRYAFPKDREITYRQLISNTSGYMKPGEAPGTVFHYQTFGMNILTHALAKLYGLYDISDPEGSPGFKQLVEEKVGSKIGTHWAYKLSNFDLPPDARLPIFGYYCSILTTAQDAARIGWLWCNHGRWGSQQVIPEAWLKASVQVNPDIRANCPEDEWMYGHGFWTNAEGKLWPDFPRDAFTASGAGGHYMTVFPGLRLVVVQNPGPYRKDASGSTARGNPEFLDLVLRAVQG